ncbi:putative pectinesterase [Helianthus annuus]|uniref:Pectinesterase n=1 Tax=Helianthus annuus TaxID=4232 RepID=A0A251TAN9_HELAN|nr:pectinesterase [Helianthus annuus]KAF5781933.1 putative pectinesterase [Helianthus annuus]KAJ0501477.1 putative pectinesterase [Helianthus annuus]KAJ0509282.1 putative pectinesterase [Helianthus annuus]KAJ0517388.1 putative pectinesterase [Helianthus annuus]KAJ0685396.1 putative pectinesterase [Helianthus annuus]
MSKTRLAILTAASLVLLGCAIALVVMVHRHSEPKSETPKADDDIKASIKAVCENTDYKQTCIDSLTKAHTQSTDPYDHVKTLFEISIAQLDDAAKNSSLMKEVQKDPRTNDAIKSCKELAGLAVTDLRRSFDNMNIFNLNDLGQALFQLKIWMSGAISYEQTCLDGFEKTEGDFGERMRKLLNQSMELTSICLALITDFSQVFQEFGGPPAANRRLLSTNNNDYNYPEWIDDAKQRILEEEPKKIIPNVTIALDGSGDFNSINEALKEIPVEGENTYVIYVKEGIYNEIIRIPKNLTHIMVMGDGPDRTKITGSLNFIDGVTTYHTATFAVAGDFFMARDIGFENTAGPEKHQAVALRVSADYTIFYNCRMDGYQDTLYTHTYRQFYRECTISGTIDFIFGDGAVVLQNCIMVVRKPKDNQNCIVTAQGRKESRQPTGLVLQNCSIVADPVYFPLRMQIKSYLGRPWKQFSRTIIMESFIDDLIQPQGWLPWNETFAFDTLFYSEFNNHGPGSSKLQRVQWPGIKELSAKRINRFTPGKFIVGDTWIPPTGVPYTSDFMFEPPEDNSKDSDSDDDSKKPKDNDEDEDDSSGSKKKKSKKKKKKKPKKDKDKDKDKGEAPATAPALAPAESPGNGIPESEISAPVLNPAITPEASPIDTKGTIFNRFFGKFI